jgi:hypothetical protein
MSAPTFSTPGIDTYRLPESCVTSVTPVTDTEKQAESVTPVTDVTGNRTQTDQTQRLASPVCPRSGILTSRAPTAAK